MFKNSDIINNCFIWKLIYLIFRPERKIFFSNTLEDGLLHTHALISTQAITSQAYRPSSFPLRSYTLYGRKPTHWGKLPNLSSFHFTYFSIIHKLYQNYRIQFEIPT